MFIITDKNVTLTSFVVKYNSVGNDLYHFDS